MPTSNSDSAFQYPKGSIFGNTGNALHDDKYHEYPNGKAEDHKFKDTKSGSFKDKLKAIVNPGSQDVVKDDGKGDGK